MIVRTVGIDLAITGPSVCVMVDAQYNKIGSSWKFREDVESLDQMWNRCRAGLAADDEVAFVMEPTGHAWMRVVAFLRSQGERHLYVPSMRKFSALRKTLNVGVKNGQKGSSRSMAAIGSRALVVRTRHEGMARSASEGWQEKRRRTVRGSR